MAATGVDIFTKQQFEDALSVFGDWKHQGIRNHNHAYTVAFGNPHALIMVYSSVAPDGMSRGEGEDSIRAWLVAPDLSPIGGKTQRWVTRKPGWEGRMFSMLDAVANLGRWIQPCPVCNKLLRLSVKGDTVYLFCPTDADNRDNREHKRHLALTCLDKDTGEQQQQQPRPATQQPRHDYGNCPTCNKALIRVQIRHGSNAGKFALSCPAKEGGRYLNHVFQVINDEAEANAEIVGMMEEQE